MLDTEDTIIVSILSILCISLIVLLKYVIKRKNKKQLEKIFTIILGMLIFWLLCDILQIVCTHLFNTEPIYFDYFAYIIRNIFTCYTISYVINICKNRNNYKGKILFIIYNPYGFINYFMDK